MSSHDPLCESQGDGCVCELIAAVRQNEREWIDYNLHRAFSNGYEAGQDWAIKELTSRKDLPRIPNECTLSRSGWHLPENVSLSGRVKCFWCGDDVTHLFNLGV